ncbi:response regulator [Nostoc sp. UCD121]|uniref:hybrid sensor histidine kinase/response regulator n=1 Tax=unclassified Nostoc TaxID=2593658 RepID=UPI0016263CE6|nr:MULTISPECIES: ATP-binding protein [unclassified Nostoc]MBC1223572.1 response regulator [Nostoc sp. UCD120]MBC1278512.1 response regulator [Nostoc sp. UCD121]MBC1294280.1 response regulator [Nostoc sp. UCD122]
MKKILQTSISEEQNSHQSYSISSYNRLLLVVKDLACVRTIEEIIEIVRLAARDLTSADGVTFVLRDGECCHYVDENAIGPLWKGMRFPLKSCISGWAMLNKQAAVIEDIYQDDRIPLDAYKVTFVKSLVMVPIRIADPLGAIGAYWSTPHLATSEEIELLEILTDTTAVAIANVQLFQKLTNQNALKDKFIAMLAHELRNPVAPISNGVQLLKLKLGVTGAVGETVLMMQHQIKHLSKLIDELLDVSAITYGKISLNLEKLNLVDLVRQSLNDHTQAIKRSNLTVVEDLPNTPVWAYVDPTRFFQIFGNLLDNALKFSKPDGTIWVDLSYIPGENGSGTLAALSVRDSGMGIEPTILPELFEPFTQADRSLDRSRGGLGLGLSVVKSLVELHGGNVEASSRGINLGAEFKVTLPVCEEIKILDNNLETIEAAKKSLKILVIEDNDDSATTLKAVLEHFGHEVSIAKNGISGVQTAKELEPHVIICDIGLPEMDGFAVAQELSKDSKFTRSILIALTGYGGQEDKELALKSGFKCHLTKPVDFETLTAEIDRYFLVSA